MSQTKYTGAWPNWVTLTGEIIAQNAKECAWPYDTKKAKYTYVKGDSIKDPNPHRYGNYGKMLDKAFPNRAKSWGKQPACGASCDVFASTSAKSTGYDKNIPRGLGGRGTGQYKHFAESPLWEDVKAYKAKDRKAGDYILYLNKNSGGHACIAGGNGYTYEAGYYSKRYGCTVKASNYNPKKKAIIGIYRPTQALRKYLQMGDRGEQTKRLQLFLRWANFLIDAADGIFGNNTYNAVVRFQRANGLKEDGKFGVDSLKAAQEWTIESKEKYDGVLPTKTLKRGNKYKKQNIYLQNFLNWYSDYELIRDGLFGPLTEEAVKDFQKQEGLVVDGIFGPKCIARAKTVER